MSALGHKQTFCDAREMSALPPKADMCSTRAHVRFVLIADICLCAHMQQQQPSLRGYGVGEDGGGQPHVGEVILCDMGKRLC